LCIPVATLTCKFVCASAGIIQPHAVVFLAAAGNGVSKPSVPIDSTFTVRPANDA
jgi:hypothetical protein